MQEFFFLEGGGHCGPNEILCFVENGIECIAFVT